MGMNDRIAKIEARHATITPGSWKWDYNGLCGPDSLFSVEGEKKKDIVINLACADCVQAEDRVRENDREFLAHAPDDVDTLLACVRLYQKELISTRDALYAAVGGRGEIRLIREWTDAEIDAEIENGKIR